MPGQQTGSLVLRNTDLLPGWPLLMQRNGLWMPHAVLFYIICLLRVDVNGYLGGPWGLLSTKACRLDGALVSTGDPTPVMSSSGLLSSSFSHLPLGSSALALLSQGLSHMSVLQSLR